MVFIPFVVHVVQYLFIELPIEQKKELSNIIKTSSIG